MLPLSILTNHYFGFTFTPLACIFYVYRKKIEKTWPSNKSLKHCFVLHYAVRSMGLINWTSNATVYGFQMVSYKKYALMVSGIQVPIVTLVN